MRRLPLAVVCAASAGAIIAGQYVPAHASDVHPSPDSSCTASWAGKTFRYQSPAEHKRDVLTCTLTSWGYEWRITGTWTPGPAVSGERKFCAAFAAEAADPSWSTLVAASAAVHGASAKSRAAFIAWREALVLNARPADLGAMQAAVSQSCT